MQSRTTGVYALEPGTLVPPAPELSALESSAGEPGTATFGRVDTYAVETAAEPGSAERWRDQRHRGRLTRLKHVVTGA